MDLKNFVVRIVADADLREKFIRHVGTSCLSDYFVTGQNEVVTGEEFDRLSALKCLFDQLGMVGSCIRRK